MIDIITMFWPWPFIIGGILGVVIAEVTANKQPTASQDPSDYKYKKAVADYLELHPEWDTTQVKDETTQFREDLSNREAHQLQREQWERDRIAKSLAAAEARYREEPTVGSDGSERCEQSDVEPPARAESSPSEIQGATGIAEAIRELAGLRDDGLISEEEFNVKRSDLLSRL